MKFECLSKKDGNEVLLEGGLISDSNNRWTNFNGNY